MNNMNSEKKELSPVQREELLRALKARFEKNVNRHEGLEWALVRARLEANPEKLIICGVLTNICVLHTTADARNRDYQVEVPADCVASPDEKAHQFALEHMEKVLGAKLTNIGGVTR